MKNKIINEVEVHNEHLMRKYNKITKLDEIRFIEYHFCGVSLSLL
jgi:hypothetical protein